MDNDVFIEGIQTKILQQNKYMFIVNGKSITYNMSETCLWGVCASEENLYETAKFIIERSVYLHTFFSFSGTLTEEDNQQYRNELKEFESKIYKKFSQRVVYFLEKNFKLHSAEVRLWVEQEINKKENVIKEALSLLNMNYKQLGLKIGVSDSTLKSIASTGKISNQIDKSIELLIKNKNCL